MTLPYNISTSEVAARQIVTSDLAQGIKDNFDYLGNRSDEFAVTLNYFGYFNRFATYLDERKQGTRRADFRRQLTFNNSFIGTYIRLENVLRFDVKTFIGGAIENISATLTKETENFTVIRKSDADTFLESDERDTELAPSNSSSLNTYLNGSGTTPQNLSRINEDWNVTNIIYKEEIVGLQLANDSDLTGNNGDFEVFDLPMPNTCLLYTSDAADE